MFFSLRCLPKTQSRVPGHGPVLGPPPRRAGADRHLQRGPQHWIRGQRDLPIILFILFIPLHFLHASIAGRGDLHLIRGQD